MSKKLEELVDMWLEQVEITKIHLDRAVHAQQDLMKINKMLWDQCALEDKDMSQLLKEKESKE